MRDLFFLAAGAAALYLFFGRRGCGCSSPASVNEPRDAPPVTEAPFERDPRSGGCFTAAPPPPSVATAVIDASLMASASRVVSATEQQTPTLANYYRK